MQPDKVSNPFTEDKWFENWTMKGNTSITCTYCSCKVICSLQLRFNNSYVLFINVIANYTVYGASPFHCYGDPHVEPRLPHTPDAKTANAAEHDCRAFAFGSVSDSQASTNVNTDQSFT